MEQRSRRVCETKIPLYRCLLGPEAASPLDICFRLKRITNSALAAVPRCSLLTANRSTARVVRMSPRDSTRLWLQIPLAVSLTTKEPYKGLLQGCLEPATPAPEPPIREQVDAALQEPRSVLPEPSIPRAHPLKRPAVRVF